MPLAELNLHGLVRPNFIWIKSTSYAYELSNVMKTQLHQSEDSNINIESLSNFAKTMSDSSFLLSPPQSD